MLHCALFIRQMSNEYSITCSIKVVFMPYTTFIDYLSERVHIKGLNGSNIKTHLVMTVAPQYKVYQMFVYFVNISLFFFNRNTSLTPLQQNWNTGEVVETSFCHLSYVNGFTSQNIQMGNSKACQPKLRLQPKVKYLKRRQLIALH